MDAISVLKFQGGIIITHEDPQQTGDGPLL